MTAIELVTQEHLQEFTDRHLALVLDKIFTAEEFIALYDGVQKENPQSLQKLIKACSKEDRLKAFVDGLLPAHKHAGEVLLWLVKKKHIKPINLEPWKLKYRGQSAEAVARRIITQYRPSPEELQRHKRLRRCQARRLGPAGGLPARPECPASVLPAGH